jgi:hypothetical protein
MLGGNACEKLCEPLLDGLKITRYGGLTSVNSDASIPNDLPSLKTATSTS